MLKIVTKIVSSWRVSSAEQSVVAIFMKTRDEVRHFYWIFSQNSPKLALTWSLVSTRQNFQQNFLPLSFFFTVLFCLQFLDFKSEKYKCASHFCFVWLVNDIVTLHYLVLIARQGRSFGKWSEACAERINRPTTIAMHCAAKIFFYCAEIRIFNFMHNLTKLCSRDLLFYNF